MALIGCCGVLLLSAQAKAAVPATLHNPGAFNSGCVTRDAADNDTMSLEAPWVYCSDGTPSAGGRDPNLTGALAVKVPAKYAGDGFTGLPLKAGDAATMAGADPTGFIALDTDVSLPTTAPPAGGYPMVVMMHGCCSGNRTSWEGNRFDETGEKWHYSNAWFASRGYVVINYTARGFVNGQNDGSTGETQLDSRSFEVNDFQALACNVLDTANDPIAANNFDDVTGVDSSVNPQEVVVTGGSYGGGFSWLNLTDPKWQCNADTGANGTNMQLAAAAPKYGWTDLAYTLVPNGIHSALPTNLPATNGCDTGPKDLNGVDCPGTLTPIGMPKTSIVGVLYLTGNNPNGDHTTFSPDITESFTCLQGTYPLEANPACARTLDVILPEFLRERSAYYQNDFFANIIGDASYRIPIFNAGTLTDPLFPAYENRRMANRLLAAVPTYPIKQYYGDYQHFVQNKAKEWGDLCGADHHVCNLADHGGFAGINSDPGTLFRRGVTTRLNRFIDNYAGPAGGYTGVPAGDTAPDVTASLQVCGSDNAFGVPGDEPGPTVGPAATFEALAPNALTAEMPGVQETTSKVLPNSHAANSDPVANFLSNSGTCPAATDVAGVGVASYSTDPLPSQVTMVGATKVTVDFTTSPASPLGFQLNARLYDVFPSGKAVMVDRGPRRVTDQEIAGHQVTYELHGNGWRFPAGHRVRIEIAQDDDPFVKSSTAPSSATLTRAHLEAPIVEGSIFVGGGPDEKPACRNQVLGTTGKRDKLDGTRFGDTLRGGKGNDRLRGRGGDDCLKGEAGRDKLRGGTGRDILSGGSGDDVLKARDGERDRVRCGGGDDRAKVDKRDRVKGCETLRRR